MKIKDDEITRIKVEVTNIKKKTDFTVAVVRDGLKGEQNEATCHKVIGLEHLRVAQ